jgi:hypothetical protein
MNINGMYLRITVTATVLLLVFFELIHHIFLHPSFLNVDVAMYTDCARLILMGKLPYVDFVDINPPFVFYFFIPPVWIFKALVLAASLSGSRSALTLTPLPLIVNLYITLFIFYSIAASLLILRNRVRSSDWWYLGPILFSFLLLNLVVFFHFGEREHIFVLTFLPFFFMRWLRRCRSLDQSPIFKPTFAMVIGLITAVGICPKPHFAIVVAAIEGYWLLTGGQRIKRLLDPEIVSCALGCLAYPLVFIICAPSAVRTAFFMRWMPLAYLGYKAYFCGPKALWLLLGPYTDGSMIPSLWIVVAVVLAAVLMKQYCPLFIPLLIWTASGYAIYVMQQKGWSYHTIVMLFGYFMLVNLELAVFARRIIVYFRGNWFHNHKVSMNSNVTNSNVLTLLVYGSLLLAVMPVLVWNSFTTGMSDNSFASACVQFSKPGDRVLAISDYPTDAYPGLIQTGRTEASKYLWTYPLTMYAYLEKQSISQQERLKYKQAERQTVSEIIADVDKYSPSLIAIFQHLVFSVDGKHQWRCLTALEDSGFDKALEHYKPMGLYNGHPIWVLASPTKH